MRKIGKFFAQADSRPPPPLHCTNKGGSEAADLDYPIIFDTMCTAARGGGADAYGLLFKHNKLLLADQVWWRRQTPASDTKGTLRPLQTGTPEGATLMAHDQEHLGEAAGQAQFGIDMMGHSTRQPHHLCRHRAGQKTDRKH